MNKLLAIACIFSGILTLQAQPRYDKANLCCETLDRGVVAIRQGEQVVVSWRTLTSDGVGEPFDVYRNGTKLNAAPLSAGGTFFVDQQPIPGDVTYEVRGGGKDGAFTLRADAPQGYLPVPLQRPA